MSWYNFSNPYFQIELAFHNTQRRIKERYIHVCHPLRLNKFTYFCLWNKIVTSNCNIYKMCWLLFTYLIIWGGVHLFVLHYSHFWWPYFRETLTSPVEILKTAFRVVIRDSRSPMNELGTHLESKFGKMLWNVAKCIRTGRDHYKNISVYLESPTLLLSFLNLSAATNGLLF